MPIVKVEMIKGKSSEYKKKILDVIHDGLMETLGIEDWDRFQRIAEYDRDDFEIPSFKTEDFIIIELNIFPGRTKDQKKSAIETITGNLNKELGIAPSDVFIIFNEPPLENWGMGGNQKG